MVVADAPWVLRHGHAVPGEVRHGDVRPEGSEVGRVRPERIAVPASAVNQEDAHGGIGVAHSIQVDLGITPVPGVVRAADLLADHRGNVLLVTAVMRSGHCGLPI